MSTPVTPLAKIESIYQNEKMECPLMSPSMAKADAFLRANLSNELRMRPSHQHAIHLSWTELMRLLKKYHDWSWMGMWRDE